MLEPLLERFRQGDRQALSRLLTHASRGQHLAEIHASLAEDAKTSAARSCRVVAITGGAGVGKSTLIGKLIELGRSQNLSVAVLACDPRSPLSGGALLGDRFRMPSKLDEAVFIRSLSAPGGQGAIALHLEAMVALLASFGFDVVFLETVGAGQGDTAVRHLADIVVLLMQPETGDELQWEKAGYLEIADIVVVQKADLPGAEATESQLRASLGLSSTATTTVLRVSAKSGGGIAELWQSISARPLRRDTTSRTLLGEAWELLVARFERAQAHPSQPLATLLTEWKAPGTAKEKAALDLLRLLVAYDE